EIRFHRLGANPERDTIVREPVEGQDWLDVDLDSEGRWLFATVWYAIAENNVYVEDLRAKTPAWIPLAVGKHARYTVRPHHDVWFVASNESAPNQELFSVDAARPQRDAWQRIVRESR